jgi:thiamine-phosphate pyrophosphorylase
MLRGMSHTTTGAGGRLARLQAARLYLVLPTLHADASAVQERDHAARLLLVARAAVAGGTDVVQLREKHREDARLVALATELARTCADLGALFIVNDSPQLALQSLADGVHVGQDDMSVAAVRAIVGEDMLIGLSTHARAEIDAAEPRAPDGSRRADYIGVGPVHETPTKPGRAAVGVELVSYAAAHARVPFFAIGGLHEGNLREVIDAGAKRVVILRAIADAEDPSEAAHMIRTALDGGRGEARA